MRHPAPSQPCQSGAGQSRQSRSVRGAGALGKLYAHLPEGMSDGRSRDAQEAGEACFLLTSCSLPACFLLTLPDVTPPWGWGWGAEADFPRDNLGVKPLAWPSAWGVKRCPVTHRGSPGKGRHCWSPWLMVSATHRSNAPCQICALKI